MAIAATHIALADLVDNRSKAETIADQFHHRIPFLRIGAMIEIEHSDVRVSIVDAGMSQKVLGDEPDTRGALGICARTNHSDVVLAVALIALAR